MGGELGCLKRRIVCDKNSADFAGKVLRRGHERRRRGQNGFSDGRKPSSLSCHKDTKNGDKDSFSCPYPRRWWMWPGIWLVAASFDYPASKISPKRFREKDKERQARLGLDEGRCNQSAFCVRAICELTPLEVSVRVARRSAPVWLASTWSATRCLPASKRLASTCAQSALLVSVAPSA